MKNLIIEAKKAMKFLVALAGVAGNAVAIGVVPNAEVKWVTLGVTIVTAVAVYLIPNTGPVA